MQCFNFRIIILINSKLRFIQIVSILILNFLTILLKVVSLYNLRSVSVLVLVLIILYYQFAYLILFLLIIILAFLRVYMLVILFEKSLFHLVFWPSWSFWMIIWNLILSQIQLRIRIVVLVLFINQFLKVFIILSI